MNKSISILVALLFAVCSVSFARDINISSNGDSGNTFEIDCSAAASETATTVYIYDDGLTGNYQANRDYTREIASTNGGSVSLKFTQFNLASGTLMTIKDAVTQQILVSNATGTSLNGQTFTSNRGSLQIIWTSGSTTGAGFKAKIWCGAMCQVFTTDIVPAVTSTIDGGETFYDVCPGSQVTFSAQSTFPQAGTNYPQNEGTLTYEWGVMFMDDTTLFANQGSTFNYSFPTSGGYYVFCNAVDDHGCFNRNYNTTRVRVSVLPTWEQVSFTPDNVCPGTQVTFTGAPTPHSWEYRPPQVIAGSTFLPDGNGTCYSSYLRFENVFPEGATITNMNDIIRIYLNMEHSYMGDLSMMLQCPNGQNCLLHGYGSGSTVSSLGWSLTTVNNSGSVGGSSTHLGLAPDPSSESDPCYYTAGEGYAYNFTPSASQPFGSGGPTTSVSYTDPCGNSQSFSTLNPGDYATYESLNSLIGCPLNGEWRMYVCDHLTYDNGWIFEWGLFFRDDLYLDNLWQFQNTYTSSTYLWSGENMTSTPGSATATAIVQNTDPNNVSLIPYTFQATDNFGCVFDTTVAVHVLAALDPSCCIEPTPTVTAGQTAPCSNSTTLTVPGGFSMAGNTGEWTYTSTCGGIASFTSPNSTTTSVSVNVYGDYTFTWHEYYQGNTSCAGEASINVNFARQMNATLTDISNTCRSGALIVLSAPDYGTLTCTPNTPAFNADARTFTPSLAAPNQYTITNTISGERCADPATSTRVFSVYDEINVVMDEPECISQTPPTVEVVFHVTGVSDPTTTPTYRITGTYTENEDDNPTPAAQNIDLTQNLRDWSFIKESALEYALVFSDEHGCSNINTPGYFACACPAFAGTFADYSAKIRCTGESIPLGHNGDNNPEGDGIQFAFVVCTNTSNIPGTAVATLPLGTTSISQTDISGFYYDTTYYVVAVEGYAYGTAVWSSPQCRSVSRAVPIMWKQTPVPTATGGETCGRVITLEGSQPSSGMHGYWTATADGIDNYSYTTINGTDNTMHNAEVFSNFDGPVTFVWHIVNDECTGEAPAVYNFRKIPTPDAGPDQTVCGLTCESILGNQTYPLIQGATVTWNGAGVVLDPPSGSVQPIAHANGSGTYLITMTERNGACVGTDDVRITFIDIPEPATTTNTDTVCGHSVELQVYNSNPDNEGHWTAYDMQGHVVSSVVYRAYGFPNLPSDDTYSHCFASIEIPGNVTEVEYEFRWSETVTDPRIPEGQECIKTVSKHVVFRKVPSISVHQCGSTGDFTSVCGRVVNLCADTYASDGFADYMWVSKDITGTYSDSLSNQTSFMLDSSVSITPYRDVPFYFTARNGNCMAIDTMTVRFLMMPEVQAGYDNVVCGRDYELHGVWGLEPVDGYTPLCEWTTLTKPAGALSPTWNNTPHDTIVEGVHVNDYGIYTFMVRETNTAGEASNCYSTDTVMIEFMQQPMVNAGSDFNVCGLDFTMNATSSHIEGDSISGNWICITGGQAAFDDPTDPHTSGHFSSYGPATFHWIETNHPHIETTDPVTCASFDEVVVTFYEIPSAAINMNAADTVTCGLTFEYLRSDHPGSNIQGFWYEVNPSTMFGPNNQGVNSTITDVTVSNYGRHDFYWIEYNGPADNQRFCKDTAGPWTVEFLREPNAQIVADSMLFCAYDGQVHVNFDGVGVGRWQSSVPSNILWFDDRNDPNSPIHTSILNDAVYPYYTLYWQVQNTEYCTDEDSIRVTFAPVPSDSIVVIPPKCFGEAAVITAYEDSLRVYEWSYGNGIVDSIANNSVDGEYRVFVHWDDKNEAHIVGLITTNSWGCQSTSGRETVVEPALPEYHYNIIQDTCSLGKGGIEFLDTTGLFAFYWIDTTENSANAIGPNPVNGAITDFHVYQIPAGTYTYRSEYQTFNREFQTSYLTYFGTYQCVDFPEVEVGTIGMIEAEFAVSADIELNTLVAPDAQVMFVNSTNYDNVGKKCEWHYGDGIVERNCDELVEHIYAEPGCYEPYLIVMNRDLPECRDTAFLDACILVDKASKLEIPNIFSPNGDGINDYFQVNAQTLKSFNGKIINRYGRLVYEWTDWETMEAGWDGKLNGSTKATPGVYYYIIEAEGYDGAEYKEQGPIHLVK